jgi:anti-sigma factor RsiW
MNEHDPGHPDQREAAINALLDGELDASSAAALQAEASEDAALARAIVAAWQLQQGMDQLALDQAPAALRRRLRSIPKEQRAAAGGALWGLPRWALATAALSLSLAAVTMLISPQATAPQMSAGAQPSAAAGTDLQQVRRTQRELAIAFHYLDKVGLRVGHEINRTLSDELAEPIKDSLSTHLPYSGRTHKEKHA